ncbi:MAG: ABC transporter substrate-binding protein [Spartobacteria bacterium]|nr:ABC transporter substrate-binding protein [Spartobacteria bacterium]
MSLSQKNAPASQTSEPQHPGGRMKDRFATITMMAMLALSMAACSKPATPEPAAKEDAPAITAQPELTPSQPHSGPVRIGGLFALTGNAQHIGQPSKGVAEMLIKRINDEGGLNGRPVELIVADTKSEPSQAVVALKRLIQKDKIEAVIGPTSTGSAMACLKTIEEAGIPMVACVGGTAPVEPTRKWVFKTPQRSSTAVNKLYGYLANQGMRRVALLIASDKFGQEGGQYLEMLAPEHDLELVATESFDVADTDMTVQLSKIKAQQPDAIIVWTVGPAGAVIARNAQEAGIGLPIFQCHGQPDPIYIKLAGHAADGSVMPSTRLMVAEQLPDDDPQKEVVLAFIEDYKANNLGAISTHSGYAWDAVQLVFNAMQKAGTDPEPLRTAIENTKDYIGVSGIYNMSPKDHCGLRENSLVMVVVEDGEWRLLE